MCLNYYISETFPGYDSHNVLMWKDRRMFWEIMCFVINELCIVFTSRRNAFLSCTCMLLPVPGDVHPFPLLWPAG